MGYFVGVMSVGILLVAAFLAGILVGRKNAKKVEMAVGAAKDPKDALKKIL